MPFPPPGDIPELDQTRISSVSPELQVNSLPPSLWESPLSNTAVLNSMHPLHSLLEFAFLTTM